MISLILIFFAGVFNAVMDTLKDHYDKSIFSKNTNTTWIKYSNPAKSAGNKWKNGDYKQGEKFFGSSTCFVALTDLWHLVKAIMLVLICMSIVLYIPIFSIYIDWMIYLLTFTITFEICYSKLLIK